MNNETVVLKDRVTEDGFRVVHLMSNSEIAAHSERYGDGNVAYEMGVWHFRSSAPLQGPLEINCEGWPKPKRFVVWNMALAGSVKIALFEANRKYEDLFSERAEYAFIRKLPRGVENGVGVGNLMLFEAEWMVRKCVAVGFNYQ